MFCSLLLRYLLAWYLRTGYNVCQLSPGRPYLEPGYSDWPKDKCVIEGLLGVSHRTVPSKISM